MDVEKLVEDEHCVRSIWELVGRLDLRLYHAQIAAVEAASDGEHTDPQLFISLWLYAYSRGISSARELARQSEYEPGCQWLCALPSVVKPGWILVSVSVKMANVVGCGRRTPLALRNFSIRLRS